MSESARNWVLARAECNLAASFEQLCSVAKNDIDRFNQLGESNRHGRLFKMERRQDDGYDGFGVYRAGYNEAFKELIKEDAEDFILVRCTPSAIVACRKGGDPITITSQWNEETLTCDLRVGNEVCSYWRISQKIRGEFFFGV